MAENSINTAQFEWHEDCGGAVIDDVYGNLECIVLPAELAGLRVIRAVLRNKALGKCRKLVVPKGIEELDISFENMEKLAEAQFPDGLKFTRAPEGINETEWFYRYVREPLYLDGWYCGYLRKEAGELRLNSGCRGVISLADSYNHWTKIHIPGSVKRIGMGAFSSSENLEELELCEGLEIIETLAFQECPKLRRVYIPDSCRKIGKFAFWRCDALEEISLPECCYRELGIGSPYPKCKKVILR